MIKFRDHSKLIMHLISMNNCGRNSEYENTSDEVSIVVDRGLNSSENEEKTFDDFIVFQCGKEQFFIRKYPLLVMSPMIRNMVSPCHTVVSIPGVTSQNLRSLEKLVNLEWYQSSSDNVWTQQDLDLFLLLGINFVAVEINNKTSPSTQDDVRALLDQDDDDKDDITVIDDDDISNELVLNNQEAEKCDADIIEVNQDDNEEIKEIRESDDTESDKHFSRKCNFGDCSFSVRETNEKLMMKNLTSHLGLVHFSSELEFHVEESFQQDICTFCGNDFLTMKGKMKHMVLKHDALAEKIHEQIIGTKIDKSNLQKNIPITTTEPKESCKEDEDIVIESPIRPSPRSPHKSQTELPKNSKKRKRRESNEAASPEPTRKSLRTSGKRSNKKPLEVENDSKNVPETPSSVKKCRVMIKRDKSLGKTPSKEKDQSSDTNKIINKLEDILDIEESTPIKDKSPAILANANNEDVIAVQNVEEERKIEVVDVINDVEAEVEVFVNNSWEDVNEPKVQNADEEPSRMIEVDESFVDIIDDKQITETVSKDEVLIEELLIGSELKEKKIKDINEEIVQIDSIIAEDIQEIKEAVGKLQNLAHVDFNLKSNKIDSKPNQLVENPLFERRRGKVPNPNASQNLETLTPINDALQQQSEKRFDSSKSLNMIDDITSMLRKNNEEDNLHEIKLIQKPTDEDIIIEKNSTKRTTERTDKDITVKENVTKRSSKPTDMDIIIEKNLTKRTNKHTDKDKIIKRNLMKRNLEHIDKDSNEDIIVEKNERRELNKEVGDIDEEIQQSLILEQDLSDDEDDVSEEQEDRERFETARASLMIELGLSEDILL